MNNNLSRHKWWLSFVSVTFLVGCFATSAKWMAYVSVDPDNLNQVLMNDAGQVVHVSEQDDGLHVTTYDAEGVVLGDSLTVVTVDSAAATLDVPGVGLLIAADTLANSLLANVNDSSVTNLDVALLPELVASQPLTAITSALNQVVAYGVTETQGWLLVINFATQSSQLLTIDGATAINAVFGYSGLMVELETETTREVISYDEALNEIARFTLESGSESLIGDSLGRPVLFHGSNHNVRVTDSAGATQWEFENQELESIDGHSVGPDGHVLLWGDNASLNPLTGIVLDSAHFLMVSADGEMQYHYLGGEDMVNIRYSNVKHFEGGLVQVSFQGWKGQLVGFVLGSNLGTPFAISRQIYHDFITLGGSKTRWMREPKRSETYAQCGSICVSIVSDTEGHCDSLDVFNVDTRSIVTASQVCGAKDELGASLPDTVKVSLY